MKKLIAILIIIISVYWSFWALLPSEISSLDTSGNKFSTERALVHLKEISKEQHYLGSEAHNTVRNYIVTELQKLGLETEIQVENSLSDKGEFSKPKNIIAKIRGKDSTAALLLLTHYDSEPHSSFGASDAGSGVVTILEGVRAFLSEKEQSTNDIIIVFTDAEELGLNGADTFVNKHKWAKDVKLVLNFEARGSGGPSFMLVETNGGNASLINEFIKANPEYPVASSLAYSVYKMLPNDTDLTRFREDKNIDGFNFAFVDDHFDYHTALDTYERLDRNTLEHQGSYLMPLLHHFSHANLNNLKSTEDYVYFNVPFFKMFSFPFSWIFPLVISAILIFIALLFYGFSKRTLDVKEVGKGFVVFITTLIINGFVGFFGWKLLNILYPQYGEILHGFTYNGYIYIVAFVCLALAICIFVYHKVYKPENTRSLLVAPLFFWLLICTAIGFKLKGAGFFVVPVIFGLISLFVLVRQKNPNLIGMALLGIPLLFIMSPFIKMFPVGLGLKILLVSTILVTLMFGLLISVFGFFQHKKRWSFLFFFLTLCFLISAHTKSDFSKERPKPNSLVYLLDADDNTAAWATYDDILDSWSSKYLSDNPDQASKFFNMAFKSKYKSKFSFTKNTEVKAIPLPEIDVSHDTIIGNLRHIELCVTSQRSVNRIEVFADTTQVFKSFKINGVDALVDNALSQAFSNRKSNRLFSYYVTDEEPLELSFMVPKNQITKLEFYEASYDLLDSEFLKISKRKPYMIPKPFVLNDAIVIKKTISIK